MLRHIPYFKNAAAIDEEKVSNCFRLEDLSISAKVSRRVGQLSFFDFLARANLNDGTGNARNNDLRPQQDWSYEGEINKQLGEWGSTQFRFIVRDVEDYVDIVPVTGGEAVGNIDSAWARAVKKYAFSGPLEAMYA